jgi:hypothetical protein
MTSATQISPPPYEKMHPAAAGEIIDENITKTPTGYLFSNGQLYWKNGVACYVIKTGIYLDGNELNIVYLFVNGLEGLKKRYGYFDRMDNFIEHTLD